MTTQLHTDRIDTRSVLLSTVIILNLLCTMGGHHGSFPESVYVVICDFIGSANARKLTLLFQNAQEFIEGGGCRRVNE